jgi:hypothetical protein
MKNLKISENTVLVFAIVAVVVCAYCIFCKILNPVVIKCLAVIGSILLVFIGFIFFTNSKYDSEN